jgi:hypothetical protein
VAGVYGNLNSREDFFRVLSDTITFSKKLRSRSPKDETLEAIDRQLQAMLRWSAGGRTPLPDERRSIDVGLVAVRELEDSQDVEVVDYAERLQELNNYFDDWPSDDEAARATEDDFFDDDDD